MKLRYFSKSGITLNYGTPFSAGLDLPYWDEEVEELIVFPGERYKLPTGMFTEIAEGHYGLLDTRSSTSKLKLDLLCHTVDSDYRGEIFTAFINLGTEPVTIRRGDFLAQLLIVPVDHAELEQVSSPDDLSTTIRGDGGFGSTDKYRNIKGEINHG